MTNQIDWDDAFSNSAYIPHSELLPTRWAQEAKAYREAHQSTVTEHRYGPHQRQVFDLITPPKAKGLLVFVHGGYWLAFDKSSWTHFADGAVRSGWAVAIPSYTLAPETEIPFMVTEIAQAIDVAANLVHGPIVLSGHSAGGQLVARIGCTDISLRTKDRVKHIVSISGVHDLTPLMKTKMNATLRLNNQTAAFASPVFHPPAPHIEFTTWVGGDERPEFLRQSQLLVDAWAAHGHVSQIVDGTHNHFSVLEALKNDKSDLVRTFLSYRR